MSPKIVPSIEVGARFLNHDYTPPGLRVVTSIFRESITFEIRTAGEYYDPPTVPDTVNITWHHFAELLACGAWTSAPTPSDGEATEDEGDDLEVMPEGTYFVRPVKDDKITHEGICAMFDAMGASYNRKG